MNTKTEKLSQARTCFTSNKLASCDNRKCVRER